MESILGILTLYMCFEEKHKLRWPINGVKLGLSHIFKVATHVQYA